MTNLIVILGAPVENSGNISSMGKGRLRLGYSKYLELKQLNQNWKILLTGGIAEHFNQTSTPYAEYAKKFLFDLGAHEEDFCELALSVNTVDDARQSLPIVLNYSSNKIIVVSSDFHIGNDTNTGRVRYIFERFFKDISIEIEYLTANYIDLLQDDEIKVILDHEKKELESLKSRGVSIVAGEIALPK